MSKKEQNNYVFEDKKFLVGLFNSLLSNPTHFKLQSILYLAYAFYSATNKSECYPDELFKAKFKVNEYGIFDIDIFNYYKEGIDFSLSSKEIHNFFYKQGLNKQNQVNDFIMHTIDCTKGLSFFTLHNRIKMDECFKSSYVSNNKIIPNNIIKDEYYKKFPGLRFL